MSKWTLSPSAPGLVLVAVAVALPWTSWLTLTAPHPALAVVQTPLWFFVVGTVAAVGCWVWQREPWLGAWVVWLAIRAAFYSWPHTFEVLYLSLFGVMALLAVQRIPPAWHPRILGVLLAGAVFQSLYVWQQQIGYDLFWAGTAFLPDQIKPVGTLGNTNYVGAYLGMLLPVAPLWLMPVLGAGLAGTHCVTGVVMAVVGLAVRFRRYWKPMLALLVLGMVALELSWKDAPFSTLERRVQTWETGVSQMNAASAVVGRGLGAWIATIPAIQYETKVGELYVQAHNEYLQLWYETGLIGLALLAGFLWQHRRALLTLPGAGAVAVGVNCLTMFPFHLAIPGLTAIVLLGLALAQEADGEPQHR